MARRIARFARLLTLPALLALGLLNTPTVAAGNPCFHGYEMPPSTIGPGTDIKLMPCSFDPTVTVIAEGESVNFINGPEYTHLVTGAAQEWGSPDVEVQPNQTVTYTFEDAGVYPYACALHPGMSGAIVVGDLADAVGAGAAGSVTTGSTDAGTSGSTDDSTVGAAGTDTANATSETAATQPTAFGTLILVSVGVGAGVVAGAAAIWLALRRRTGADASGILARAE
jgi:plastocyanin